MINEQLQRAQRALVCCGLSSKLAISMPDDVQASLAALLDGDLLLADGRNQANKIVRQFYEDQKATHSDD